MLPKRVPRWLWCGAALLSAGAVALVVNSCSTPAGTVASPPPQIPGAHYVGDKACLECHAEIAREFAASPHARFYTKTAALTGVSGCESCHGPGSRHVETAQARFIVNPGNDPSSCLRCHLEVRAEFNLPHHHAVFEGRMNCVQCHDPHGGDIYKTAGGLAMARLNETCAQCHRDQTRPFVFEHEAMREGCTVCHNPHGSINRKMLVQDDPNLCLKCHAQVQGSGVSGGEIYIGNVPHTAFLQMGTCWTAGCHTAIHGSNLDPRMRF